MERYNLTGSRGQNVRASFHLSQEFDILFRTAYLGAGCSLAGTVFCLQIFSLSVLCFGCYFSLLWENQKQQNKKPPDSSVSFKSLQFELLKFLLRRERSPSWCLFGEEGKNGLLLIVNIFRSRNSRLEFLVRPYDDLEEPWTETRKIDECDVTGISKWPIVWKRLRLRLFPNGKKKSSNFG